MTRPVEHARSSSSNDESSSGSSTQNWSSSSESGTRPDRSRAPFTEAVIDDTAESNTRVASDEGIGQAAADDTATADRGQRSDQREDPEVAAAKEMSWVSLNLRGQRSKIQKGSQELEYLATGLNEGWRVEGMAKGEDVAAWTDVLKFTMYRIVFERMGITPPFTRFQRQVLRYLQVAPSQLNPNAWAFLQAYEDVLVVLRRPVSIRLFFTLFEMSYIYEKGSKGARKEAVSFKNRSTYNFFKPYMESLTTGWKREFFWVVLESAEAHRGIAQMSKDDQEGTPLFPTVWSFNHFSKKPGQYAFKDAELDDLDRGTIQRATACSLLIN